MMMMGSAQSLHSSSFSFGTPAASATTPSAAPTFSFGAPAASSTAPTASAGTTTLFGGQQQQQQPPSTTGGSSLFSGFGQQPAGQTAATPAAGGSTGFSFGGFGAKPAAAMPAPAAGGTGALARFLERGCSHVWRMPAHCDGLPSLTSLKHTDQPLRQASLDPWAPTRPANSSNRASRPSALAHREHLERVHPRAARPLSGPACPRETRLTALRNCPKEPPERQPTRRPDSTSGASRLIIGSVYRASATC